MNMPDINKCHRGVLLWTEDLVKFNRLFPKTTVSTFLRDKLHEEMSRYPLTPTERKSLKARVEVAKERRSLKHPNAKPRSKKSVRILTTDIVPIPKEVRASCRKVSPKKAKTTRKGA